MHIYMDFRKNDSSLPGDSTYTVYKCYNSDTSAALEGCKSW